jgi:iron complex outermembrane recepter protein
MLCCFLSLLSGSLILTAQQQSPMSPCAKEPCPKNAPTNDPQKIPPRKDTVVVTGTFDPVQINDIDRSVSQLPVRDFAQLYPSAVDFLKLEPSLDLRERAPGGVQTDVSIRGSSFGQTLILVNGLSVADVQSGHHNMDIPLPLSSLDRIEVLRGAGSTFYGSSAVGGAVNFITAPPPYSEFRLGSAIGNFGTNEQNASAAFVTKRFSQQLSFARDFSSGFMPDRDYRSLATMSDTHLKTRLGDTGVLLAYSDRPFGADQFYGNYPSWERTKSWLALLRQELGKQTELDFAYRRHSDVFDLFRSQPWIYENNHVTDSWQAALRRHDQLSQNGTLSYGVEGLREDIDSTNLGVRARNRGAVYVNYDMRAWNRLSFSVGGREEIYNSTRGEFSPTIAAGYWLGRGLKLRASASHAFRIPTYTDLYYSDPANVGNPFLRPESAWSYEGGVLWDRGGRVSASATLFQRRDRNVIDYAKCADSSASQIPCDGKWHALNLDNLNFTGVETNLQFRLPHTNILNFAYTGLHGSQDPLQAVFSKYAFSHLTNSGTAAWQGKLPGNIIARTRLGVAQRYCSPAICALGITDASRGNPYPIWDAGVSRQFSYVRARLAFSNLSGTGYEETQNVIMPGRSVLFGLELVVPKK